MTDHVDNPFEFLATLSICTGIRGLERGVERVAGPLRTIAYVEVEAFIIENLLAGMEAGMLAPAPIWANLKTFPWEQFRGKVGLLMGGYPCQPFSTAGLRKGADDPRHLWPFIEHGIRTVKPVCCFFENVSGHLTLGFEQVAQSLRAMGYAVEAGIFTAEEVGAPHKRARLFILAILADANHSERRTFGKWRNSTSSRKGALHGVWTEDAGGFAKCGQELADTLGNGTRAVAGNIGCEGQKNEGEMEREGREGSFGERSRGYAGDGGSEMADAAGEIRSGTGSGEGGQSGIGGQQVGDAPGNNERRERIRSEGQREPTGGSGSEGAMLDDTIGQRLEGQPGNDSRTQRWAQPGGSIASSGLWPAGPGQPQYDWEEPRTMGGTNRLPRSIRQLWRLLRPHLAQSVGEKVWQETDRNLKAIVEPGMGSTIDGYSFREDLLRALGNGVVEQTAELAFRILLEKHFS